MQRSTKIYSKKLNKRHIDCIKRSGFSAPFLICQAMRNLRLITEKFAPSADKNIGIYFLKNVLIKNICETAGPMLVFSPYI